MKYLHSIHHYLGTLLFAMFLIWFLSGFVMMYKSFPFLSSEDKLSGQRTITLTDSSLVHPAKIFPEYASESSLALRINQVLDKVVYHYVDQEGDLVSRLASTTKPVSVDSTIALQIARDFSEIESNAEIEVLSEVDQWIPRPKYQKHLPVYKVKFKDSQHSYVYVSSVTGEVISHTTRADRIWAWLGAIPHWLYFTKLRMMPGVWSQVCIWLSAIGFVMSLAGIITGIVRWRKKPKANFKRFKNKWYNFHYYTGLAFGVFVCTWILSGFMSMSPFNWSYDFRLSEQEKIIWEGNSNTIENISDTEWLSLQYALKKQSAKELSFSAFNGKLFTHLKSEENAKSICLTQAGFAPDEELLLAQIRALNLTDSVVQVETLNEYDNYYYDRHNKKTLPVYKATTQNNIAYYITPNDGKVLLRSDITNKLERWLYHGLHSLDFRFLTQNRPLWDIVVIFLMLGGTTVCVTAVGLGVKFIKRKNKRIKMKVRRKQERKLKQALL